MMVNWIKILCKKSGTISDVVKSKINYIHLVKGEYYYMTYPIISSSTLGRTVDNQKLYVIIISDIENFNNEKLQNESVSMVTKKDVYNDSTPYLWEYFYTEQELRKMKLKSLSK